MAFGAPATSKIKTGMEKSAKKKKIVNVNLKKPTALAGTGGDEARSIQGGATMPAPKIKSVNPNPSAINPAMVAGPGPNVSGTIEPMGSPSYNPRPVNGGADRNPRDFDNSNQTGGVGNPMSGFASRYDPTKLDPLYSDPNLILEDLLKSKGMATGSGMAEMGDYAQRMGTISDLLALTQSGTNGRAGSDENWINTVAELLNNSMGPGGTQMDYQSILGLLLDESPQGGLGTYLYGDEDAPLTVGQQDQFLNPMFLAGITGMSPAMQRAMANAYQGAQTAASRSLPRGTDQDPRITGYLRDKLAGIIPGL